MAENENTASVTEDELASLRARVEEKRKQDSADRNQLAEEVAARTRALKAERLKRDLGEYEQTEEQRVEEAQPSSEVLAAREQEPESEPATPNKSEAAPSRSTRPTTTSGSVKSEDSDEADS